MMNNIDFENFEQLSEEEKKAITSKWTDEDWFNYFASKGTVTLEEFRAKLKVATREKYLEKCKEELCNDAADALITALSDYEVCVNHTKDNFDIVKTDIQERLNRKREELGWFPNQRICLTAIACDSKIGNSTLWEWAKRMDKIDKDDKLDQFLALFQKEFRKTFGRSIWISVPAEQSGNQSTKNNTNTSGQVMNHYTGNITPGKDIIFVFGSNPEGRHGAGSAKVALQKFGAKYGKGDGLYGQSYALITTEMRKGWPRITLEQITDNVRRLYEVAREMPDKRFMVAYRNQPNVRTLCGYTGAQMMQCFLSAGEIPTNIWFSEEWYNAMQATQNVATEHQ